MFETNMIYSLSRPFGCQLELEVLCNPAYRTGGNQRLGILDSGARYKKTTYIGPQEHLIDIQNFTRLMSTVKQRKKEECVLLPA
jgi:hypothetical protein